MDFMSLAESRYSCRRFSDRPVEQEKLQKIIDAAILAPTAVNRQPFRIFAAETEAAKEAIRSCTKCHFGAETFLIVGTKASEGWVRPFDGQAFAQVDGAIAATHMMLMIQELGLATTWVGYFDAPALKAKCPALEGWDLIAIFPIGYPAEGPSPRHSERKSADQLVSSL